MKGGFFMKKINTKMITICGFLVALNIVLSTILTIPGIISFNGFPIIFAGIVFGPLAGGIVGTIGDIISFIIRPTGVFMPHFVLTSALTGIIPGIIIRILNNNLRDLKVWQIFVAILIGQTITTVLMVPYFRQILFAQPFIVNFTRAVQKQAINIPAYAVIMNILIKALYTSQVIE